MSEAIVSEGVAGTNGDEGGELCARTRAASPSGSWLANVMLLCFTLSCKTHRWRVSCETGARGRWTDLETLRPEHACVFILLRQCATVDEEERACAEVQTSGVRENGKLRHLTPLLLTREHG